MQRTKGMIALAILVLMAGMLSAQIKFPVTDDGTALTYGTVVSVDGTNPNQVVAADGTDRTQDVVGVVTAVQNVGGTDYYLVVTEGFLELSGATFTPGDRLTVDASGNIVSSTNDEDILIGYAISATRVQILIDDDQARFTYFDDTDAGLGADNVQEAIDSLNDNIDDITSEDITFEGVVTFDSTVIFGDDSVYFGGPAIFDSTVEFNGPIDADTINVGWLIGTEGDTIYFEQYLAGPEVVIDSIEAFGDGAILIKDSTRFTDDVHVEGEIEVDGDGVFHDNLTVDDTLFANILDADSAFFNYTETGDLVVNDSAYFGGPVVFDSTVVFNGPFDADTINVGWLIGTEGDTIYFEQYLAGPEVVIDSIEAFGEGAILIKDSTRFTDDVHVEGEIEVDGDGVFHDNLTVDDTLFANILDADSAFLNYTETGDLVVNDSAYFGGPVVFDSTVVFNGPFDADTINVGWLIGTEGDTIYFEQYLAGPEVVIDSIEAFGDGAILIKDSTRFTDDVHIEGEIEVDGDGVFHDNLTVDDTLFANILDADSAFFNYTETGDLVVNDSAYFGGPVVFDSTVVFNGPFDADTINVGWLIGTEGDTIYFEQYLAGPEVVIDSIEAFGDGAILIKDSTRFTDDVHVEGEIEVDGDGVFHDNLTVDDTLFANILDADSAFFNYTETGDLVVNDSAYFGGPVVFDSTVVFNGPFDADTINVGWLIGTEGDTIYFEQYLAGPEVVIDSIEAFGDGAILIKDSTRFTDDVHVEGEIEVDGDGVFHDNLTVDDTLFANILDADSAFFNYTETGDLIVNDSAYFGGPSVFDDDVTIEGDMIVDGTSTFDSTVVFGDDSVTFGGPVTFDSTVTFSGDIVLNQNIVQASRSAVLEFDTTPTEAIALTFTTSGDVIELSATVVVSDEYSTTPNYNGAKITVELYDVTNTTVLKSYTVFLQDKDWYEIKEVSISHVMSAPAADNDYSVRCFADGWGNGGRIIEGDLTVTAIQQ